MLFFRAPFGPINPKISPPDISKETFFEAIREEKQVSTTQIPLGELVEAWQKLLEKYDELVYIPLSGEISGGYETGVLLSRQFDGKVTVIDSRSVSLIEGAVAIEAAKLAQKGYSGSQIKEKLAEVIPENIIQNIFTFLSRIAGFTADGTINYLYPIASLIIGAGIFGGITYLILRRTELKT